MLANVVVVEGVVALVLVGVLLVLRRVAPAKPRSR